MAGLDEVFSRLANDPSFADAIRTDPTRALGGYRLDALELRRLEQALGVAAAPPAPLFQTAAAAGVRHAPRFALLAASVAAVGAVAGFGLGAGGAFGGGSTGEGGLPLAADAAVYYSCSDEVATGAVMGELHRGDTVWVIGQSSGEWLVIRDPRQLTSPAWMPRASLDEVGATADLPEMTCERAANAAATPPSDTTTAPGQTTLPDTTMPGTTVSVTSAPATVPPTTPDTTGPTIAVTPDRDYLYSGLDDCPDQTLDLTVTATDPSGQATITSVTWARTGASGTAQALGANRYRIPEQASSPPAPGVITLTVTAADALGNVTTTSTTVDYLAADFSVCIPG